MAKKKSRQDKLVKRLRAAGLRKKAARTLAAASEKADSKRLRKAVEDLRGVLGDLESRVSGVIGSEPEKSEAPKAAQAGAAEGGEAGDQARSRHDEQCGGGETQRGREEGGGYARREPSAGGDEKEPRRRERRRAQARRAQAPSHRLSEARRGREPKAAPGRDCVLRGRPFSADQQICGHLRTADCGLRTSPIHGQTRKAASRSSRQAMRASRAAA